MEAPKPAASSGMKLQLHKKDEKPAKQADLFAEYLAPDSKPAAAKKSEPKPAAAPTTTAKAPAQAQEEGWGDDDWDTPITATPKKAAKPAPVAKAAAPADDGWGAEGDWESPVRPAPKPDKPPAAAKAESKPELAKKAAADDGSKWAEFEDTWEDLAPAQPAPKPAEPAGKAMKLGSKTSAAKAEPAPAKPQPEDKKRSAVEGRGDDRPSKPVAEVPKEPAKADDDADDWGDMAAKAKPRPATKLGSKVTRVAPEAAPGSDSKPAGKGTSDGDAAAAKPATKSAPPPAAAAVSAGKADDGWGDGGWDDAERPAKPEARKKPKGLGGVKM